MAAELEQQMWLSGSVHSTRAASGHERESKGHTARVGQSGAPYQACSERPGWTVRRCVAENDDDLSAHVLSSTTSPAAFCPPWKNLSFLDSRTQA